MSTLGESINSSGRWIRPDEPRVPYAMAGAQKAVPMAEASSPPEPPEEVSSTPPEVPGPATAPRKNVIREPGRPMMRIRGEPFFVEREGEDYYIVHDRWSLMGAGKSLSEAYKDFLHMTSVLAPVYGRTPPSQLDEEGTRLTRFLLHSR